jgi:hypothetical protein
MNVGAFLITNAQSPKLIEPSEGPLHNPAPSTESTAMFGVALRKPRHDVAITQALPDFLGIITAVA